MDEDKENSSRSGFALRVWLITSAVVVLGWALLSWNLLDSINKREQALRTQNEHLVNALQLQVAQVLESIDIALDSLAGRLTESPRSNDDVTRILKEEGGHLPDFFSMLYIDADGKGVAASVPGFKPGGSFVDRDYFQVHAKVQSSTSFIGGPLVGRTFGKQFFTVSRRLTGPDGRFLGVLMGSVEPKYFARIFEEFPLGRRGAIALLHSGDKKILARAPDHDGHFAQDVSSSPLFRGLLEHGSGQYETATATDGTSRVISFHRVKSTPLVMLVGFAREDLIAEFEQTRKIHLATGALLTALLAALAWQVVGAHRRATNLIEIEQELSRSRLREAQTLRESTQRLNEAQRIAKIGSWELDLAGNRLNWSDEIFAIFEIDQNQFGASYEAFLNAIHPDDRAAVDAAYRNSLQSRTPYEITHRLLMGDGRIKHVHERCETTFGADGKPQRSLGTVQDVTERVLAEERIRLYAELFKQSAEGIIVTDSDNGIIEINPAFTSMTGFTLAEVRGKNPKVLASGKTPRETYQALWTALVSTGHWQGELWDRRKDGSVYPKWTSISVIRSPQGEVMRYIASFTDISERKLAEERIKHLAHYDPLTGLLNRYSLESRLEQALLTAQRDRRELAVLFIDLDRFKLVNDTLGHASGDLLLKGIASRLKAGVRESDIVARQGGDEFVVCLTNLESNAAVLQVAEKLLRSLAEPYLVGGQPLHSTPSIGIALFPGDADNPGDLLKNADAAMYAAKEAGRNRIHFFTDALMQAAQERLELERELVNSVREHQLELHYQPQVRAADGRVCGVEALVRWRHPERGLVPPLKFIPIAEDAGLIEMIGLWVLEEACRQLAAWRAAGILEPHMAVNLSAHQLRSPEFVENVAAAIRRHGLAGSDLELEVTESVAMEDPERAIEQLRHLRALGVRLAVDDFGTGYSSLAYLKRLPIQTLKLDRSFVKDIETDANNAAICAATVALAHKLGLKVVAEGIETEAQRDFMAVVHGCDVLQGYLFSRPQPAAVVVEFLRAAGPVQGARAASPA